MRILQIRQIFHLNQILTFLWNCINFLPVQKLLLLMALKRTLPAESSHLSNPLQPTLPARIPLIPVSSLLSPTSSCSAQIALAQSYYSFLGPTFTLLSTSLSPGPPTCSRDGPKEIPHDEILVPDENPKPRHSNRSRHPLPRLSVMVVTL